MENEIACTANMTITLNAIDEKKKNYNIIFEIITCDFKKLLSQRSDANVRIVFNVVIIIKNVYLSNLQLEKKLIFLLLIYNKKRFFTFTHSTCLSVVINIYIVSLFSPYTVVV